VALPCSREKIALLNTDAIWTGIIYRRRTLRGIRDARLDERCWITDYLIWEFLDDSPPVPLRSFFVEHGMEQCVLFYRHRRSENPDAPPPEEPLPRYRWDYGLVDMLRDPLIDELVRIQLAARRHRDIEDRPRTINDDRALYGVLPENVPADFRLPSEEEFLGRAKPEAGCSNFWDSHAKCGLICNLRSHEWGPCSRIYPTGA